MGWNGTLSAKHCDLVVLSKIHSCIMNSLVCILLLDQIRLLFNRKNKTLRAVMTTKSVIKLLEDNRKTMQALNNNNNNNNSQSMETEEDNRPVQEIIEGILEKEPWKGQRASKLDIDDFLQLLSEFNEAGIHFC